MKITCVETITLPRGITTHAGPIRWLWLRLHTDEGLTGLGETYPFPEAEAGAVHGALARTLLGQDPSRIDWLWREMHLAVSFAGWAGAEIRAISAVDMALWDLAGKVTARPLYELLGGASRQRIPTYNTCYDHIDFHREPERLAGSLLESGIRAMKIWPFDPLVRRTLGQRITAEEIEQGMEPLARIRKQFGRQMDVALEFHGFWSLAAARQIARALEPLEPMWLEEMLPQDNLAAYRELALATRLPLTLSERLVTRWGYRELFENRAAAVIMPDIEWCGGISEAKKIATAAETHYLPVAPHNCGGPVLHAASLHLAANLPNLYILESVRRHYADEYRGLVTNIVQPQQGEFPLPPGPGLGLELDPSVLTRADAVIRRSEA